MAVLLAGAGPDAGYASRPDLQGAGSALRFYGHGNELAVLGLQMDVLGWIAGEWAGGGGCSRELVCLREAFVYGGGRCVGVFVCVGGFICLCEYICVCLSARL